MTEKEEKHIKLIRDKENRRAARERVKRQKERRIAITIAAFFVVIALIYSFWNRYFNAYEELTSTPNSDANYTQFATFGNGYFKYSKDGVSYLDADENIIWTEAYNMEQPSISIAGEYAAIADLDGNQVKIYDVKGITGDYSMPYPIRNVQMANQGVFCIVLEGDDANYIRLYDSNGGLLADIKTQIENNGYPLAVAISSDGEKLAASFYGAEGINSKNVLSFYNFGEGGKGQNGNLVGTYQFEDMLIPKIVFMDDETVCVVGDNQTIFYQMKEKPKKIREINFDTEIKSVFSDEKYIGFVIENDEADVESALAKKYQILLYNKYGKLKESFGREVIYENIRLQDNVIYCYSESECSLLRTNGTEFFCKNMGQNIVNILPGRNRREFLFLYSDRSARVRLKNSLNAEADDSLETEE
ncbi:MAG: DUF5711 family protein [Lachnospiraceae bacterium]|nr:DUF5711 family protein [Lachnospiraceae bacterium]